MRARRFKMFFGGIAILAVCSAVVMLLWNLVVPGVFGWATINFWQALGLFALARILFGGFGAGRMMMMAHGMHNMKGHNPIHEKWMKMSPEERIAFVEKRRKFGFGGPFGRGDFFDNRDCGHNRNSEPGKDDE